MASSSCRPVGITWEYDRVELIADGIVHALEVSLGLAGAIAIVILTANSIRAADTLSVVIYTIGLLTMLRLEWCGLLRANCSGSPELEPLASRGRRHPLLDRRHLSCVGELAVSKRDLAWLRTGRRMLPLFGRSRLCGVCAGLNPDVLLSQIIPASKKID